MPVWDRYEAGEALAAVPSGRAAEARSGEHGPDRRVFEAASMYYAQGETMDVIARHLRVSRSTVSRLLSRAREEGVVRIELVQPGGAGSLEEQLAHRFGVRAQIVPVREGTTEIHRLQQVAAVAATRLTGMLAEMDEDPDEGDLVLGVAWGTTMSEVSAALAPRTVPGLTIVQLNGASDPMGEGPSAGEVLARMGDSLGARTVAFPVPAFFDRVTTREAMWSERSIKRVLSVADRVRLAVFGVGSLDAPIASQVYAGGHLSAIDMSVLRTEGVVGDVCTVMLRADGTWIGIDVNARATGPTPAQLSRVPRRLCVVAGVGKASAALAALRARVATDLVIDDATARVVLSTAQGSGGKEQP